MRLWVLCVVLAACKPEPRSTPATSVVGDVESGSDGAVPGVRFLEHMTGGARADERVPMIVALHPMGGDPADMWPLLRGYQGRARVILPYGLPRGGMYFWFDDAHDVASQTDRLAATLDALAAARPTVGKPIVTGFSQGGFMAFALAAKHPDSISAAFPMSGVLPTSMYPSATPSSFPRVVAFHGEADLAVPIAGARASIVELQRVGYAAELRAYPGLEHLTSDQELRELFEQLARSD